MASENRELVKKILGEHGRLTSKQIMEHAETIVDERQMSNLLYSMKATGAIVRHDDRTYSLADGKAKRSPKPARAAPAAPKTKRAGGKHVAALRGYRSPAVAALREAMLRTQLALNEYLLSVGDPAIIEPLKARARFRARRV